MGLIWIFETQGGWQISGDYATTKIETGQREYVLDNATALKINKIEIKPTAASTEYIKATKIDSSQIPGDEENYHPAVPEYDLMDNSIFIFLPNDIEEVTAGIKLYFQKELTDLSGTTDEPIIPEPFVRLLSAGSALDYCYANEKWKKAAELEKVIGHLDPYKSTGLKADLQTFFANRAETTPAILTPKTQNLY
jgi:hypothetical protein